jgi:hypothetical protein
MEEKTTIDFLKLGMVISGSWRPYVHLENTYEV